VRVFTTPLERQQPNIMTTFSPIINPSCLLGFKGSVALLAPLPLEGKRSEEIG